MHSIAEVHPMEPYYSPKIVCLCGSTRFWEEFQKQNLRLTMEGEIVLSIGAATGTDDEHFGNLAQEDYERIKNRLDKLHLKKIEIADEVLVLNVGGYIGASTAREILHAMSLGKPVRFLEPVDETLLMTSLPQCPCCHSNERVTISPPESAARWRFFCPCNEPGKNPSGHFNA